jgi:tripartite-type tricarboxylate transporter receptor subunit TctC
MRSSKRTRRTSRKWLAVITVLGLVISACGGDAEEYPSQNFTWVVPYSPGGGFDTYSRGFAQVMAETQLPDGLNIVVENITPIAEALSRVYRSEDPYQLAILPMPAAAAQEIQFADIAQWETDGFTVLGSIEENAYVVYVAADSPYQTFDDLAAATGLRALTVERGSSSGIATAVAIRSLGLDAQLVFGAEGSQEVATALIRGDIDFIVYGTSDVIGFIDSGDVRPLLFLGLEDQRPAQYDWLTDVPSVADVGFPDIAGAVTEMRLIVAPAGLGAEEVAWLEAAVEATLFGPEFAAWAASADRPIVPRNAESARQAMRNQIATMQELVPLLAAEGGI